MIDCVAVKGGHERIASVSVKGSFADRAHESVVKAKFIEERFVCLFVFVCPPVHTFQDP